jgi:hypothetical protein
MEVRVRIRAVLQFSLGLAYVFTLAAPAAAQGVDQPRLGAGVSFLTDGDETGTGFVVDLAGTIRSMDKAAVAIVGDVGFHHFDGGNIFGLMGGVRFSSTANATVTPFGQFLLGLSRSSSSDCTGEGCTSSDFALAPGGGVDVKINDRLSFRAQVDWVIILYEGDSQNAARLTFGISMPVGRQ